MEARSSFLGRTTGGGLDRKLVMDTMRKQYGRLENLSGYDKIILWFDACLFDQAMLCHVLNCLNLVQAGGKTELICVDSFPGILPYNGLGQLSPEEAFSVYGTRQKVSAEEFSFASRVDRAFAIQDMEEFSRLARMEKAPIPWVPAAVRRWLEEQPDSSGLGKLQRLAIQAVKNGKKHPLDILKEVASKDTPPRYWGDTTLWSKINSLAEKTPPLVSIKGPADRLPQWTTSFSMDEFSIFPS
jgi:hypothetical protein